MDKGELVQLMQCQSLSFTQRSPFIILLYINMDGMTSLQEKSQNI